MAYVEKNFKFRILRIQFFLQSLRHFFLIGTFIPIVFHAGHKLILPTNRWSAQIQMDTGHCVIGKSTIKVKILDMLAYSASPMKTFLKLEN